MEVKCDACGKSLTPWTALMYERSLDNKKVEDSDLVVKGWSCPDIDCLSEATGIAAEVKRERDENAN